MSVTIFRLGYFLNEVFLDKETQKLIVFRDIGDDFVRAFEFYNNKKITGIFSFDTFLLTHPGDQKIFNSRFVKINKSKLKKCEYLLELLFKN